MTALPKEFEFTAADGCRLAGLHYPGRDQGPTCLLVHGLGVDANVWSFVAPALQADGFDVLCPDLRGHGRSESGARRAFQPGRMVEDLAALCRAREAAPSIVLGQSFGSWIALDLTRRHRAVLGIEVCIAVTPVWYGARTDLAELPGMLRSTLRLLRALRAQGAGPRGAPARRDHGIWMNQPDWHLPRLVEEAGSIGWDRYARLLLWLRRRALQVPDWRALAPLPVRLVVAARDGMWNNREIEQIQRLSGWPLERLDMRHLSPATDPAWAAPVAALVRRAAGSA